MTLMPVEARRLSIPSEPGLYSFTPNLKCGAPYCQKRSAHSHHIVPRSRTSGPEPVVAIDGIVQRNVVGLCPRHHLDVTGGIGGHKARIRYCGEPWPHWCWEEPDGSPRREGWLAVGPLDVEENVNVKGEM